MVLKKRKKHVLKKKEIFPSHGRTNISIIIFIINIILNVFYIIFTFFYITVNVLLFNFIIILDSNIDVKYGIK